MCVYFVLMIGTKPPKLNPHEQVTILNNNNNMKINEAIEYLTEIRNEYGNLDLIITHEDEGGSLSLIKDFKVVPRTYSYAAGYFSIKANEVVEGIWD